MDHFAVVGNLKDLKYENDARPVFLLLLWHCNMLSRVRGAEDSSFIKKHKYLNVFN